MHGRLRLTSRGGPGSLELRPGELGGVTAPSAHTAHQPCFRNRPGTPQVPFSLTCPRLLGLDHCSSGHRQEDPPHGSSQACPSCPHLGHLSAAVLGGGSWPLVLLWVSPPVGIWGCLAPQGCQERGHKCPHPHLSSAQAGRDVRTCERPPAGRGGCRGSILCLSPAPQVHIGVNS